MSIDVGVPLYQLIEEAIQRFVSDEISLETTDLITGWDAAILLGITWGQWKTSQWRCRTGKASWPQPVRLGRTRKYDVFRRQDVLDCKPRFWRNHFLEDRRFKKSG